jgi:hypothetical protein
VATREDKYHLNSPPIVELAIAIQIAPQLPTPALGGVWKELRGELPRLEEQHPLPPIDSLIARQAPQSIALEVVTSPSAPRLWLMDKPGAHLFQVQSDRLARNWRRLEGGSDYPRFETIRDTFKEEVERVLRVLSKDFNLQPVPTHAELHYVDHVLPSLDGVFRSMADVGAVLRPIEAGWFGSAKLQPEAMGCFLRYPLGLAGPGTGSLTFEAIPARRGADGLAVLQLQNIARTRLPDHTWSSCWESIESMHDSIRALFFELTTPAVQAEWGKNP